MTNTLILIDGDILVYMIALANERKYYICNNKVYKSLKHAENASLSSKSDIYPYKYYYPAAQLETILYTKLNSIFEDLGTRNYVMYITDRDRSKNYRNQFANFLPYKGNRTKKSKPFYYTQARNLLMKKYGAIKIIGEEADDAIGKKATDLYAQYNDYEHAYIASIDKDLQTIPGYHYHLKDRQIKYINQEEAEKNFIIQLLQGDRADNVPGLYRLLLLHNRREDANKLRNTHYIAAATKFFVDKAPLECYNYVKGLYCEYGYSEEDILEIGRLLWIKRYDDDDWQNRLKRDYCGSKEVNCTR